MNRNALNKRFFGLVKSLGIDKEVLYDARGIKHLTELSDGQLYALCTELSAARRKPGGEPQPRTWRSSDATMRDWRSNCLNMLTELGVYYMALGEDSNAKWSRVNAFCASPRIAGAPFGELSVAALKALYRKLCALKDNGYYYKRKAQASDTVDEHIHRTITKVH